MRVGSWTETCIVVASMQSSTFCDCWRLWFLPLEVLQNDVPLCFLAWELVYGLPLVSSRLLLSQNPCPESLVLWKFLVAAEKTRKFVAPECRVQTRVHDAHVGSWVCALRGVLLGRCWTCG